MRRCEGKKMVCADVKMCRCQDEQIRCEGDEGEKMICADVKM